MSAIPKTSDRSLEQEVYLSLQRLLVTLNYEAAELFKEHNLSAPQFNILRILRGAANEGADGTAESPAERSTGYPEHPGLSAHDIGERLLVHAPDLTRLLDRMSLQGLVTRYRATADRRVVTTRLTDKGRELLAELDAPLIALHAQQLSALNKTQLGTLLELLNLVQA